MSLREDLNIAGRLTLRLCASDGRVVEERSANNDITIHGRQLVGRLFNRDKAMESIPRISRICVGQDGHAFKADDNALGARVGSIAIQEISEEIRPDATGKPRQVLRLAGELAEREGNGELREAGLFTDKDEVMYNRVVFPPINKTEQFTLKLIWEIMF